MNGIARRIEAGAYDGPLAFVLSQAWALTVGRSVERPLAWPSHIRGVAIGGATLGGSGKTPLALACAAELAAFGARTALVGHAYRARPKVARPVRPSDRIADVGDEALVAAAALEGSGARVVVGPTRANALGWAAAHADVVVLDGVSQTSPTRASLALLAVDAEEPWGRGQATPPRGDLRAPLPALAHACDIVVPIHDSLTGSASAMPSDSGPPVPMAWPSRFLGRPVLPAHAVSRGVWVQNTLLTWETVRSVRVGLLSALARPERLLRFLARRDVHPKTLAFGRDHGPLPHRARWGGREDAIDLWLVSAKCAQHVPESAWVRSRNHGRRVPIATLDYSVTLDPRLCVRLHGLVVP